MAGSRCEVMMWAPATDHPSLSYNLRVAWWWMLEVTPFQQVAPWCMLKVTQVKSIHE